MSLAVISEKIYKAFANDNINYLTSKTSSNPIGLADKELGVLNFYLRKNDGIQTLADASKLNAEEVLDVLDDRTAYQELDLASESKIKAASTRLADERKFYNKAESWIIKNASRYEDPEKFKKAFKRTFPKNNFLLKAINSGKNTSIAVQFSDDFKKEIFGTGEKFTIGGRSQRLKTGLSKIGDIGFIPKILNDVFKTAIYNFNPTVRNKILNEFKNIVPKENISSPKKLVKIKKSIEDNKLFKKFGINKSIKGPISRLLYKDLGETLSNEISTLRKPRVGTVDLLKILKDKVNPKYKTQFEEALSAAQSAVRKDIPEAKKKLKIAENINFDHRIPKSFVNAGYADEINLIKLTPTLESFNMAIKANEFDKPMMKLAKKYEASSGKNKSKILKKMEDLKSSFNKKNSNYLKDITIKDVKGKPFFESTDTPLSKSNINKKINDFVQQVKSVPGGCRTIVTRALGGPLDTCEAIIKADPERAAAKLNNSITATKGPLKNLKDDSQKLIRLFRGEPLKSRTAESVKALAKKFNISEAEAGKRILEGQWYTPTPEMAGRYTDKLGKMKYVDVTPAEYLAMNKYTQRINKTNDLSGKLRYPVSEREAISIVPRRKLKQFEETGRMKSKRTIFGDVDTPMGTLKYDSVVGGFIDPADPTKLVDQAQIKTWAQDNPMPVRVGEEPLKVATNKSVLKNVGKTLATIGAPLPTALLDGYFINEQVKEGKGTAEIASNPLNWLGLATMSTLSDISGVSKPGKLNAALRLGLNPGTIRGISRFAGLPGLAVSTAMTAYDQYKKYQNEEGFIYNLFNKEEK